MTFLEDGQSALLWAARYLEEVSELPVLARVAPGEIRARLPASPPERGEPFAAILHDLDEVLLPGITHWQHPRFFAYFSVSASEPGILAELLAAVLNSVAILWRTAPAPTRARGAGARLGGAVDRTPGGLARPYRGLRVDVDAGGVDRRPPCHRPQCRGLLRTRALLG